MKKIILGTTALVAATAFTAGSASAADKIKLNVGGYLQTSFVAASYDDDDRLPTNIRHEGEVQFTGKTTLDNGLEFGVNIQLEARQSGDQVDETFMYVEGGFGRVNMGSEDSASYLMHYGSSSPTPAFGLNSPNANASGYTTPSTLTNDLGDKDKLTYFTPRMGGFQFGASYTPDASWETGSSGSPYGPLGADGGTEEAYSIAANFVKSFGDVSVAVSAGYQTITVATSGADDNEEISVGGQVGFAGFKLGAGYKFSDNDGLTQDLERDDFSVSLNYGMGPWSVGVQYAGVRLDGASDGDLDAFMVGGKYTLGPGITAYGGVQFYEAEDDVVTGSGSGDDATVFFLGTSISF